MNLPGQVKSYVVKLLGPRPTFDANNIFVCFALHPGVVSIANSYFGLLTRLLAYNVWYNLRCDQPPRESQLWHRDPEDRYILKMFVFLDDVDEGGGPTIYAPGPHALGAVKTNPES